MNNTLMFIRLLFVALCILLSTAYTATIGHFTWTSVLTGVISGFAFGLALIALDQMFKRFNFRAFNVAIIGLFCGYLMSEAVLLIFRGILGDSTLSIPAEVAAMTRLVIFLCFTYLGMVMAVRSADELHLSIPFIKLKAASQQKKDILPDASALLDARMIDLANSGLVDHCLLLPRFVINELNCMSEGQDEVQRSKARRALDGINKLKSLPTLELRLTDDDVPEVKDSQSKLFHLARKLDAKILTTDINRIQHAQLDGVRVVNLNMLANALKPVTQSGEFIQIKIQRYGKEARQGVGYLDDGTMVVVNGGAEFIGDTIKAQVLSVKHTSSGRMIFCNTLEDDFLNGHDIEEEEDEEPESPGLSDSNQKSYYTL